MIINPVVAGRGMAGQAMLRSLAVIEQLHPELQLTKPVIVSRGQPLTEIAAELNSAVLLIANPHALHARTILEAEKSGFKAVITEKPCCTTLNDVKLLRTVAIPVTVLHGFRAMWGPRRLCAMAKSGEFGRIISVEGNYWHSSAAQRAADPKAPGGVWKNDISLSGPFDTLFDLGSHWTDLAVSIIGELPSASRGWLSYVNAEALHRDSHVHLDFTFPSKVRARASISKTVHGTGNELNLTVIGEKKSARWGFFSADELEVGEGSTRQIIRRTDLSHGSGQRAYHGLGWLEGYIEIIKQTFLALDGRATAAVPTLPECLDIMELLLKIEFEK